MAEHTFPGPEFPGPLSVRISLPDGWRPLQLPGVAMAFVDGGSPEGVPANIVVLVSRVADSATLDDLAAAVREQTAGSQVATLSTDAPRIAGRQAIRTVISAQAHAVSLIQAQTVLSQESIVDGQLDVVQVHLTCRADQWPAQEKVLHQTLATLAIG